MKNGDAPAEVRSPPIQESHTPYFTVIVPTYNRPQLLDEAVQSVMSQTWQDWELIVVDDCGDSEVMLPADPRVRLLRNDVNSGKSASINAALGASNGSVIVFLDDDDLFGPERLRHAYDAHESGAEVAFCDHSVVEEFSHTVVATATVLRRVRPSSLRRMEQPGSMGRVSILRDVCPLFDENYRACEDLDWGIRVLLSQPRILHMLNPDWFWRRHTGARNKNGTTARIEGSLRLLHQHTEFYRERRWARAYRWRRIGLMSLSSGDRVMARRAAVRSILIRPSLRTLKLIVKAAWQ